jgi:hypothetical protein
MRSDQKQPLALKAPQNYVLYLETCQDGRAVHQVNKCQVLVRKECPSTV